MRALGNRRVTIVDHAPRIVASVFDFATDT
jgi:hypothetical protein